MSSPLNSTIPLTLLGTARVFEGTDTAQVPFTVKLPASHATNGFRVVNSSDSVLFSVDQSGNITIAGSVSAVINETLTGDVNLTGTLTVAGATTLNGNITLGNAATDTLSVYANSIFRYNATVWNDLAVNNDVYISHSLNFEDVASTPNSSGNHGKVYTQLVSGVIELHYIDSSGNIVQITSAGAIGGDSMQLDDNEYLGIGNTAASPDVRLGWNTAQTVDGLFLGLSDGQNTFVIAENGDRAYDFAHGAQTNPTVYLQSAAQSATEFSAWNASKISFGLGIATVATDYVVGRNADGTNLLQFNVPTGASFEFSVNDVAQMTMSATAVNFQDNSLTTTGGGSLTGTWTDLGIVTTVDINGGTVDGTIIGGAVAAAGTFTAIVGTSLDLNGALDLDVAALGATITNTADTASSQIVIFEGDRATVADGDEAYLTFRLSDSGGTQDEGARITWKATTVLSGATQDTDLVFSALVNNVLTTMLTLDGSANEIVPAVAINSAAAITGTAITATSFVIGANTLTTSEWAFLDGQDQSVFTTSNPTFGNLTITSFAANWTNAGRTVADLGIVTTVDINGGTLDGVTIGGASAAAATFTTIAGSTAGNVLTLTNSTDAASVQVGIIQGDRATIADGDEAYLTFRLSDSAGNQDEQARITWKATTVLNGATQDGDLIFSALVNNVLTEAMRIDGSVGGYVGIGTTAPVAPLNIQVASISSTTIGAREGRLAFTSPSVGAVNAGFDISFGQTDATDSRFAAISAGVGATSGVQTTGYLQFSTKAGLTDTALTERMRIASDGDILIGATANYADRANKLEVNSSGAAVSGLALNMWSAEGGTSQIIEFNHSLSDTIGTHTGVTAAGSVIGGIEFNVSDGTNFESSAAIFSYLDGTGANNDTPGRLVFYTTPDGSTTLAQRMTVLNSGVVTIGGTTNTAYGSGLSQLFEINTSAAYGGQSLNTWSTNAAQCSTITFQKSASNTIGTNTLVSATENLGLIEFRGGDGTDFDLAAYILGALDTTPGAGTDMPGRIAFYTSADGSATPTERLRITSAGVISSLLAAPTNVTATGAGIFSGGIAFTDVLNAWIDDATHGDGTTTIYIGNATINTTSDMRLKSNIVDTQVNALDLISQLHVVDYNWNDKFGGHEAYNKRGTYTGLLAQEAIKIAPTIINANGGENCLLCLTGKECSDHGDWHVEYDHLVGVIVRAIQELNKKVEALTK